MKPVLNASLLLAGIIATYSGGSCVMKSILHIFGGVTFTIARTTSQATPLVMRDVAKNFKNYFIVRAESPAKTIADFKGKRLSFDSRFSTSGHLMPRYFLQKKILCRKNFSGKCNIPELTTEQP
jgi:ABC-type phosphate/phosphonate transport system substrate-binding protein